MVAEGRGVVLYAERRRKLATVAARRGVSITAVLGELIDRAYEATESHSQLGPPPSEQASSDLVERLRLVEELVQAEVEDVPDPETLRHQLQASQELAKRQALVATILRKREARRIAPLTSTDLVHQAREEAGLAHGHDR